MDHAWGVRASRAFLVMVFLLQSCQALAASGSDMLARALASRLAPAAAGVAEPDAPVLRAFYHGRGYRPLWIDETGPQPTARILLDTLLAASEEGLAPADYGALRLEALLHARGTAAWTELEVGLSRAVMRYGADLEAGRATPAQIDPELFIEPDRPAPERLLAGAAAAKDLQAYLSSLAPQAPEYRRLKAALAEYREIVASGGWEPVLPGESLRRGNSGPSIAALRRRLVRTGDLAAASDAGELFDDALDAAVRRFQRRHGLVADGVVGPATLEALNVPASARVEQLRLNMERRRWMPDDLGPRYVFINTADFVLKLVEGGRTLHDARVVVGAPYRHTPVFSAVMTYLVLNPYWEIPPSIAREEILPRLRQDPGLLERAGIRVLSGWGEGAYEVDASAIDWKALPTGSLPYRLRQDPGEDNALGRVKFMFPNRFNVYLHDTPARDLFRRPVRAFSHGCIRLEEPLRLAILLLRKDPRWMERTLNEAVSSGKQLAVRLPEPVPIHVTYLTAWVNKDDSVHFRNDVYGRDRRLSAALRGT